jgi:osmoprotectant transport system substrate-binding protein
MKRFLLLASLLLLPACGPPRTRTIVVGSKNFTEQVVLGEMIAQMIQAHTDLNVERRFYLGGTYICQQAILAGRIDVYPEYTGTMLTAILKQPAAHDAEKVYRLVKREYAARFNLDMLPPFGFNNTFAIVIRGDEARRDHIRTISDAVPYVVHWRPGFGYEFMDRPDGYKGLVKTYGLKFGAPPRIMDLGLLYRALKDKQVDLVAGNATDGLLDVFDVTVLKDDKDYFPPYQAVPVLRRQILEKHPEVVKAIERLAGEVSEKEMRRLNYEVDGLHQDARKVAHDFLAAKHLL